MTTADLAADRVRRRSAGDAALLLAAFAAAVAVRVAVAGPAGPQSAPAGLVFAAVLATICLLMRTAVAVSPRVVLLGLVGAAVLVAPVVATGAGVGRSGAGFVPWAVAVTAVATAEEAFLRGALFDAVTRWRGSDAAVVVGAVAFALLHLPLYGWHAMPLDLAVGLGLGALRLVSGSWTAPAIAHVGADLVGWWLP